MFPNLEYDNTLASKYAQTLSNYLKRLCKQSSLDHVLSLFPNTLPISVLTVRPLDDAESGSSFIGELMNDVHQLGMVSKSVNRSLKDLKPLLKGDPTKPKDEELDGRIEEKLASLGEMKGKLSSLEPKKKRLWNDLLAGMVKDLSKRSRRRETTQQVERHDTETVAQEVVDLDVEATNQEVGTPDQEVTDQETASVNEVVSSQE